LRFVGNRVLRYCEVRFRLLHAARFMVKLGVTIRLETGRSVTVMAPLLQKILPTGLVAMGRFSFVATEMWREQSPSRKRYGKRALCPVDGRHSRAWTTGDSLVPRLLEPAAVRKVGADWAWIQEVGEDDRETMVTAYTGPRDHGHYLCERKAV